MQTEPNPRNDKKMFQIFQNVQYNVVQHKKYVKEMKNLYMKMDPGVFQESFSNALLYLFTFGDSSANVDRVIQFVASFCAAADEEGEFLMFICDVIFNCQCVVGQAVRFRASQLLAAVLSALGDEASLDMDLCDKLLESQLERLQDTRAAVRCRAALALQRLQDPSDPQDPVSRAYIFHMSCDPSPSVRRAIIMSIAKCARNVPYVVERVCDVDEGVRRAAFLHLAAINMTQLKVRQRVQVLKVGLTERAERVRRVVEEIVVPGWAGAAEGNVLELMRAVRLDHRRGAADSRYVADRLLDTLFKRLSMSELLQWLPIDKALRLIPAEQLNRETAWYWRRLVEFLHAKDDDETLDTILPDLVVYTGYIRAIVESPWSSEEEDPAGYSSRQSVLRELATLLRVYDCADEASRQDLQHLLYDTLTGEHGPMSAETVKAFVCAMELVFPDVVARTEFLNTVVGKLRAPAEPELERLAPLPVESDDVKIKRAQLRVSLNVAAEEQQEAVSSQNYALAAECKAKVDRLRKQLDELNAATAAPPPAPVPNIATEKRSGPEVVDKCLVILNSFLDSPQITTISPLLRDIFDDLEIEIFQDPDVVQNALVTVALYGMLDRSFAEENKSFFISQIQEQGENEELLSTVLQCIVDLLCVHGALLFEDTDATSTTSASQHNLTLTATSTSTRRNKTRNSSQGSQGEVSLSPAHPTVIELLLTLMENENASHRGIIATGLCRLFMLGHLESPSVLSRFLLLWFNPATVEEDELRQTLGVFFQTYVLAVDDAHEQIQKAIIPTLRVLARAPLSSPIASIDQEALVRFLVSLTRVHNEASEVDAAGSLGVALVSWLAGGRGGGGGGAPEAGLVCRLLALLPPPRDVSTARQLLLTLTKLEHDKMIEKSSWRNVHRYVCALEAVDRYSVGKAPGIVSTMETTADGTTDGTTDGTAVTMTGNVTQATADTDASYRHARDTLRSTTGLADADNSIATSRGTMPGHPLARSTHIMGNVHDVDIDETSPPDGDVASATDHDRCGATANGADRDSRADNIRKPRVSKRGGKKLSTRKVSKLEMIRDGPEEGSGDGSADGSGDGSGGQCARRSRSPERRAAADRGSVKRSRSQRSQHDVASAKEKANPEKELDLSTLDLSNVTFRRSTRVFSQSPASSPDAVTLDFRNTQGSRLRRSPTIDSESAKSAGSSKSAECSPEMVCIKIPPKTAITAKSVKDNQNSSPDSGSADGAKKAPKRPAKPAKSQNDCVKDAKKESKKNVKGGNGKGRGKNKRKDSVESDKSGGEPEFMSDDDTVLNTIVYEQEEAQSVLPDSSDDEGEVGRCGRQFARSVVIPATPDTSDLSDTDIDLTPKPKPKKAKGKKP